jgi:large subunit ribosomal protein L10
MMAKVAPWKKDRVSELAEILSNDGIVGIVDIGGVPAGNMLGMRDSLRDQMTMTMSKKTLIRIAWEQAGLSKDGLGQLLDGAVQPCIVHSESLNPFELFATLDKTRQGRAAKEGEKAPSDIVVEKGPTEFGPGPIVGEFNAVGIPAKIDKGKVAIQKTVTVVNEGETISGDLGIMLAKLGITPIEIGLILTGVIEDGVVFPASSLDLDLDGFKSDVISATSGAFNLACNTRWFSATTMPTLLSKASSEAMSVAIEAGVVNDETASLFISRANAHAMAIAGQLDSSALDEALAQALGAAASTSAAAAPSDAADSEAGAEAPAEEEEGEEEEAGFDGLGDLFG